MGDTSLYVFCIMRANQLCQVVNEEWHIYVIISTGNKQYAMIQELIIIKSNMKEDFQITYHLQYHRILIHIHRKVVGVASLLFEAEVVELCELVSYVWALGRVSYHLYECKWSKQTCSPRA